MKVGIYGDSFAARHGLGIGDPWHQMLTDKFNIPSFSYGVNGSSLYYSFSKFEKTHHLYKKIVFVATSPGRFMLPQLPEPWADNPLLQHINSYQGFKNQISLSQNNGPYLRATANAIDGYYKYVLNFASDNLFHRLMIKEITAIRPDALVVFAFSNNGEENATKYTTLNDVSNIDIQHYNIDINKASWADKRHCHMNQENNYIFASMIADWVNTGYFNLDISKFITPSNPIEEYFNIELLK